MVEIQCPHCEEAIILDEGAFGFFDCPHCDEEFEFEEPVIKENAVEPPQAIVLKKSASTFTWDDFYRGLLIPSLLVLIGSLGTEECSGFICFFDINWLFHVSFWTTPLLIIAIIIFGAREKRKGIWIGAIVSLILAPFLFIAGAMLWLGVCGAPGLLVALALSAIILAYGYISRPLSDKG